MHYDNLERAYLIGLLHDLGKVVLVSVFRKDFENAIFNARVARQPLHTAERTVLDFDHADAGAWLGEKWDLPDTLLVGIQYHHDTRSAPKDLRIEALLAACGNHFAHVCGMGSSGTAVPPPLPDGARLHLKMESSDVKAITAALEKKRGELEAVLQMLDT